MVTIKNLLQDDLILVDIAATDKPGVLREFARLLTSQGRVIDEEELVRTLIDREVLGSTGIGGGVAIPHGKLKGITDMIVAFGRSRKGVDFQALDGKPVYLFFLLLTPPEMTGEHLKTLARISRILKNQILRENLQRASFRNELQRLICEEDSKYPQPQAVPLK
ncbi:MAG TPA: fructose PTS transporter subunit IIA [Nitrospirota bacterium]|nr:fructose PTS transporter subunit IIA [Nitrospirota bacterium]